MIDNATAAAKELTFTKELDGVMGDLQAFVQQSTVSPLMRMFFRLLGHLLIWLQRL